VTFPPKVSRRRFVQSASMMTAGLAIPSRFFPGMLTGAPAP
jgi:ribosomal protein S2